MRPKMTSVMRLKVVVVISLTIFFVQRVVYVPPPYANKDGQSSSDSHFMARSKSYKMQSGMKQARNADAILGITPRTGSPSVSPMTGHPNKNLTEYSIESPTPLFSSLTTQDQDNDLFNSQHALPDHLRLCRIVPSPIFNTTAQSSYYAGYQCAGEPYNDYMLHRVFPLIQRKHGLDGEKHSPKDIMTSTWGRRSTIIPFNKNATIHDDNDDNAVHILCMGNSHTRQSCLTMIGQYREQIVSKLMLGDSLLAMQYKFDLTLSGSPSRPVINVSKQSSNDSNKKFLIISLIFNHPIFYSGRWMENLIGPTFLNLPSLDQLDTVVLGGFNPYITSYASTVVWGRVAKHAIDFPEHKVNTTSHPKAFSLLDLSNAYNGPILWLSSFSEKQHVEYLEALEIAQNMTASNNAKKTDNQSGNASKSNFKPNRIQFLDARRHLEEPELDGVECSSNSRPVVATCTPLDHMGHKCMGEYGGYPDLVANDIVETFWVS